MASEFPSTLGFVRLDDLWHTSQHFRDRELLQIESDKYSSCEPETFGFLYARLCRKRLEVIDAQLELLPYAMAFLSEEPDDVEI